MKQDYQIRKLSLPEMEEVYEGPARRHFPANELKPLKAIKRMYGDGCYEALGLFSGTEFLAYAFYVQTPDGKSRLLDYYAVMEEYRSSGVGSLFLSKMREWYRDCQCIILETEDLALAKDEKERETRARRNAFYVRNGGVETEIHVSYFAADYQIFYLPIKGEKSMEQVLADLKKIYRVMFQDKLEKIVEILNYEIIRG
ncbi:MAG: GNAT family N-acetyltransferase [Lachnospiraceae bacterium]|nr:GNAT family N-acetyltransferase [Lachnospiraceae bacterium]